MRWLRPCAAALAAIVMLTAMAFAAPSLPALTGRVVDNAGILSEQARVRLAALSAEHEKQTGNQVVVATVKSTDGYEIEQYANELYRAWGLGDKKKSNGVLLLVSMTPKRVRIEVGYGLEGELTDLQSKLIITNTIAPAFKKGDYDGGLTAATVQIMRTVGGKPSGAEAIPTAMQEQPADQEGGGIPIAAILILLFVFGRFFWPLLFVGGLGGGRGGGYGGFGGGSFGGGFGGGGFSGGGGSSGGGGASGSW